MNETDKQRQQLRAALIEQLEYLTIEAEALRPIIGRVPEALLEGRPMPEDLSVKETYGLLAALDEDVHALRLQRLVAEDDPRFAAPDPQALVYEAGWNDRAMPVILDAVQTARRALTRAFEALPPDAWLRRATVEMEDGETETRDAYELAHAICQHDADRLRAVGQRLHESHMPKE